MTKLIADYIPPKVRAVIYSLLGLIVGLEAVWDVVPQPLEGQLLATLTVLGFGLALSQTPVKRGE